MSVKSLKKQNTDLKSKIKLLENASNSDSLAIRNSLTTLVQSAGMQSNLTSLNPVLQNNIYYPLTVNWTILTYMYKTHGVIQTAIDMPVLDALRGGLDIRSGELDKDDIKELNDKIEETDLFTIVQEAETWARLYGGAGIIINTEQDPSTPFKESQLKGRVEFYACNRWELVTSTGWKPDLPNTFQGNVPAFSKVNDEYFYFYGNKIHKSRVITLTGKNAPYIIRWQLAGWGMSEVERMLEDFNSYIRTKEVTYELLEEAKIDVYRIKDLAASLATSVGTQKIEQRIALTNRLKNFNRALVMDMQDEYQQKQLTFSGLAEVMKENRINIASALRMPMTKLFGLSAQGFASGEDDIENYNAMVESEVRNKLRKPLRKLLRLLCLQLFQLDINVDFDFKPLRVMSTQDEEQVKTSKQARYATLYDRGLLSSQEMGEILEHENLLPIETDMARGILEDHPEMNPNEQGEGDEPAPKTKDKAAAPKPKAKE